MEKWLKILLFDFVALLLGIALTFAFSPYEIFPLAIVSLAGLLALWKNVSGKRAFWLGFMFGIGLFGVGVYWVFISVHTFGDVPTPLALIITAALILYLALFPASVGYFTARYFPPTTSIKTLCAFPALWVLVEWVRSWAYSGFPWLLVGYSQTNSPLKGYAALLSVYGVSLAVALTSSLCLYAIYQFKQKNYLAMYKSLFAITALWIIGALFNMVPWTKPMGQAISVSLVQGGIPQAVKWSPEFLQLSLDRYQDLTQHLWEKEKFIIWPEAAIPLAIQDAQDYINKLDKKAKETNAHLILGIPFQSLEERKGYYNGIVSLGTDKKVYFKRHLVPFGEYIPFSHFLTPILTHFNIPTSDLIPGQDIQTPFIVDSVKILPAICYEIAFPELMNSRDKTTGFVLTVTNDAWFGRSAAQAQHLQMAQMRALELKRPVLLVSNDGITAIIESDGNIQTQAPPYIPYILNGTVQPAVGLTPWMRNGMDPILFISLVLLAFAIRENRSLRYLKTYKNKKVEEGVIKK